MHRLLLIALVVFPLTASAKATNDRNWVAMHIFDSIYPVDGDDTFIDALSSIETVFQQSTIRQFWQTVEKTLHLPMDKYGSRSNMGHFLMWAHFSDDFVAKHQSALDTQVQPFMFMYPDHRKTDIFTAWGGNINLAALLTQGIIGLGAPLQGNFQAFPEIVALGDADYEGGWYMTDEQAEKLITAFNSYPGIPDGYSFLRSVEVKPNAPYEPPAAQLVNGYNCGDFVMYALRTAGVLSHDEEESLKIKFWYPEAYYASPLPLRGSGAKGAQWLRDNPNSTQVPQNTMLGIVWPELLFSNKGMQFFDKKLIAEQLSEFWYPLNYARVWDQAHVIAWLKTHNDFRSKGILTELYPAVVAGTNITSPDRTVTPKATNCYTLSKTYRKMIRSGNCETQHKLAQAGLTGARGQALHDLYEGLKALYPAGATGGGRVTP